LAAAQLGIAEMQGIDNSASMLAQAAQHTSGSVTFVHGDIGEWTSDGDHDLVLANASLHWVADHERVLRRWAAALRPGGQLAVQVPSNAYMPSHTVADDVAHREPFLSAFGDGGVPPDPVAVNVLAPEKYASLLYELGFEEQHVRLQVYAHMLPASRSVVDWVRGTTLTRFQQRLDAETFAGFLVEYERALIAAIGDHSPYFFPFRRILMWGRRPS
jgi:trans-aconitate 2-methyltransferase